jgi:RNA polymerase sigma factor (sigma-70 family)
MTALPDWNIVTDAELADAAAAGDRAAFAGIYDRYADRLHDFCVGMVRDRDAAADCVQEVFCTAAVDLPKLRDPDKLRPWLYAIARHQALRTIRERRREPVSDELPDMASHDAGPDTLAARNELAELIAQAAGGLADRDREVLELAYRHGLNGPDLAEALGVSPASAKKLVQRLRETIERSLGALLVARRGRTAQNRCPELGAILQGWDGQFTILMRKRIARHIDSCPNCDADRRRLVNPVALLGGVPVFIPAPSWLRERTLGQIRLSSANVTNTTGPADRTSDIRPDTAPTQARASLPDDATAKLPTSTAATAPFQLDAGQCDDVGPRFFTRRLVLFVALFVGIPLAALGFTISWLELRSTPVAPIGVTNTAPAPTTSTLTASPPPSSPPPPPNQGTPVTTVPNEPVSPRQPLPPTPAPTPSPPPPPSTAPTVPPSYLPPPPPVKPCTDGGSVPLGQRCPTPPVKPCPDGSTVPADQTCPTPPQPCPDGSTVPAGQTCPSPPPAPPPGRRPPVTAVPGPVIQTSPPSPPPIG